MFTGLFVFVHALKALVRLRISHVISKKYSNGILNLHVHVKKVHVIMSGEISANVCLV